MPIIICTVSSTSRHPAQLFSVVRTFEEKTRKEGVGHGQDVWAAVHERIDGCSREALRAAHLEMETVKMRSDEGLMTFSTRRTGASTA